MTFLLMCAIIVGLFLVLFLVITLVRSIQEPVHSDHLSSQHLSQLQTSRFSRGDRYETCAICLEDYKVKDKLRILPCSHGYHTKCIDPWLTNNQRICPICKQEVVLTGKIANTVSDSARIAETTPLLLDASERIIAHGTFNSSNMHSY